MFADPPSIFELKESTDIFPTLVEGRRTFAVCRDAGFKFGDLIVFREWMPGPCSRAGHEVPCDYGASGPCPGFTGREFWRSVGEIYCGGWELDISGFVVLSLLAPPPASSVVPEAPTVPLAPRRILISPRPASRHQRARRAEG